MPVHNFVHSHGGIPTLNPKDQSSTDMQALSSKTRSSQATDLMALCTSATVDGKEGSAEGNGCAHSDKAPHHKRTFTQHQTVSFELLPDLSDSDKYMVTPLRQKLDSIPKLGASVSAAEDMPTGTLHPDVSIEIKAGKSHWPVQGSSAHRAMRMVLDINSLGYEAERLGDPTMHAHAACLIKELSVMLQMSDSSDTQMETRQIERKIQSAVEEYSVPSSVRLHWVPGYNGKTSHYYGKARHGDSHLWMTAKGPLVDWADQQSSRRLYCYDARSSDPVATFTILAIECVPGEPTLCDSEERV